MTWKTLVADRRYPYHLQRVQNVLPSDIPRKRVFCDWFRSKRAMIHNSRSKLCGQMKLHLLGKVYSTKETVMFDHKKILDQSGLQCNVWLGILNNTLIGPHFPPNRSNANGFIECLANDYYDLVENIPCDFNWMAVLLIVIEDHVRGLTSYAGMTCRARREFFVPKLQYFLNFKYIQV